MIKQLVTIAPIVFVLAGPLARSVNAETRIDAIAETQSAILVLSRNTAEGFEALDQIASDELVSLTGRDNLTNVQSIQELDATISNSSFNADTIMSGAITIEQHALENFEGVGMFNIFTGNNNAVDSAVGISIFITE